MTLSDKTFRKIITITFTVIALLWVSILLKAFLFAVSYLTTDSIDIIGGADIPAYQFILLRNLSLLFWLISIIAFTLLNFISFYKKSNSKSLNILVVISFILMISGVFLTPPQSYAISLYAHFRWFIANNAQGVIWSFYSISFVVTVLTGLSLLPLKRKKVL